MTAVDAPAGSWTGGPLVDGYRNRTGPFPAAGGPPTGPAWDELTGTGSALLPGWAEVARALEDIGPGGLPALTEQVDRLLADGGVTYVPVGSGDGADTADGAGSTDAADPTPVAPQPWPLDPVPLVVDAADWQRLETALAQRSTLLDLVLQDLYGDRDLVRRGLVPAELVYAHDHYLRAAHGIRIPGAHQLFFHAVDLCRGPDGHFLAVSDRAQAPSGSGYAVAGRRVVSRVLPGLFRQSAPRGLAPFFRAVNLALQAVAPHHADDPRTVLLSPGSLSETAFDQAAVASLLGVPLVEGADLTVRDGRLWMRALGRYEPVDVVLRRVDAAWSDPLDLRPGSQLGVAGLTEACRRGTVTVVNTLGSGAVENPGLLPLLPRLARALLAEDLLLPSVPTVWCGDPDGLRQVLARFDELVLRPTGRGPTVDPATLSPAGRERLRARIAAEPARWVGQERAPFAEAPVVVGDRLVARRVGLRAFVVAQPTGYLVLPGGLGRVLREPSDGTGDSRPHAAAAATVAAAVAAKDVWVRPPAVAPASAAVVRLDTVPVGAPRDAAAVASPRVLEDLFWLGRYAERTEDLTRLLLATRELVDSYRFRPDDPEAGAVAVLLGAVTEVSGAAVDVSASDPLAALRAVVLDGRVPGTVAQSLAGLQETARSVRDQLSSDTWMVLAAVDRAMAQLDAAKEDTGAQLQATKAAVLSGMLALSGLSAENMVRDPGWRLMDIGRRLERAQQLSAVLRAAVREVHGPAVDEVVLEAVLAAAESGVTYRRRYRGRFRVASVLDLLALDAANPRSLAYQVDAVAEDLRALPDAGGASRPERLTEDLAALLRRADATGLEVERDGRRVALTGFLDQVHGALRELGDAVAAAHFRHSRPMRQLDPYQVAAR
ncbi:circularly permuted type 2 ATP-grasp protein [Nakamurella endophytica]|uniref:DUF403 domain-containing protein n=1 Tax=Nakamurella endophytica TaxID=1748367 RepID=A0A917WNI8_9ACTN|nr:circularly permuted type 2 ATP-grasp protein [Nakamurella endophytica]GGM17381.1 hypothetical protein GCM10011594_41810 [Nakamurella endophytica]